ncbi:hypothetical protein [Umezawaea sp. NPDC059074]|uniref:hypothetical protein n=1 Tax=Umezawaea sp. NPDC059074 TaxID=3346716 RepID=UPI0036A03617
MKSQLSSARLRVSVLLTVVAAIVALPVAGSAAPAEPVSAQATTTAPVAVGGAVGNPLSLDGQALRRFPAQHAWVRFESGQGTQHHSYRGALLIDVLNAARPSFDPAVKNDKLRFAVLAAATDGYQAVVSWGEIDAEFAGTKVLVAYEEDRKPLTRPRLVVPGDVKGGRYVSDVESLTVVDLGR